MDLITSWGGFERLVAELHKTGEVEVQHNVTLIGRSGAPRQVDVLLIHKQGLYTHTILVECKYLRSSVERTVVDALSATVQDLNASKGVIFTTVGFQSGAQTMAKHAGIDLFLVREPKGEEWGLPGRVIDFYLQFFSRSLNPRTTFHFARAPPSTNSNLALTFGKGSGTCKVTTVGKLSREMFMEQYIDQVSRRVLRDKITTRPFLLNGGEECTRYLRMPIEMNFDPAVRLENGAVVLRADLDFAVKVHQTRLVHDRASNLAFALLVENFVTGERFLGTREQGESFSTMVQLHPKTEAERAGAFRNGSILQICTAAWFDHAEVEGFDQVPMETLFQQFRSDR